MLSPIADQNEDDMTLDELGVAGLFDDDALANDHEVRCAPAHQPIMPARITPALTVCGSMVTHDTRSIFAATRTHCSALVAEDANP